MEETEWLARRFEEHRPRLRAVAYRMLGSVTEADDAVQDAWLQLNRSDADEIDNLGGWLTTVVARECLHMLRTRRRRREDFVGERLPDPVVAPDGYLDPEQEALLADSVGFALLVVLDSLTPAERLAFVLHDMFELPFEDIARLVERSPAATRQLASRARRRVKVADVRAPDVDVARQREVVDAFFAATRAGDFDSLVKLLDPDIVLRADFGLGKRVIEYRGVHEVVKLARAPRGAELYPVLVNGQVGTLVTIDGQPFSILAFTVADGRIVEIDGIRDPGRVQRLAATVLRTQ
ncbi:MAG: sigma-70 family RNA polymerase sigma factor [Propionibacteriales bacterium]|nr:sigma-70 family RNA polymerase sigma factor [Propionibacteriales bacterium]